MRKNRVFIIAAVLVLLITGCGGTKITTADLISANASDKLLESHEAVRMICNDYDWSSDTYYTRDLCYIGYDDTAYIIDGDDNWQYDKESGIFAYMWYAMSVQEAEEARMKREYYLHQADRESPEKVMQVKDNGDGTATVTTTMDKEMTETLLRQDYDDELPEDYYGSTLKHIYTIDSASEVIRSSERFLVSADKEIPFGNTEMEYDGEMPELMKTMLDEVSAYKERMQNIGTEKIVTVIYDEGTDHEESFDRIVDPECQSAVMVREGYTYSDDTIEKEVDEDGTIRITVHTEKLQQ